ncbi:MAG TPA: hypothetical protein VFI13_03945, partial [Gemmatimonadales bacterium]|nr:hypothetical protein [Gemmatimonadales bacterium]
LPAPWTGPTDSIRIFPPRDHVYLYAYRRARQGRWWVYGWREASNTSGVLSTHDRDGRLVDSVAAPAVTFFRWTPSGRALILPLIGAGRQVSGFLRIAFDPSTGHFGGRDTLALPLGVDAPGIYDLTPDGMTLTYDSRRLAQSKLTFVEGGGGRAPQERPVATATTPLLPAITPDGRTVLYRTATDRGDSTTHRWWIADPNGGTPRPLTPEFAQDYAYTVDDAALYRVAYTPHRGSRVIRHALADGTARTILDSLPGIADLAVGAHGTTLLILANGDSAFLYDSAGAITARVGVPDTVGSLRSVLVSPDGGEYALFLDPPVSVSARNGEASIPLLVLSARTGTVRIITTLHLMYYET